MKGLPMVKKKILLLLAVIFVLVLGISCYFFRGRKVYRISARGLEFKELLYLSDFRLPSDHYSWTCPSSVTVSNQTFKIDQEHFDIKSPDGGEVASFSVGICPSAGEALDVLCDQVVRATYSVLELAWRYRISQDAQGNMLFEYHPLGENCFTPSRGDFSRTYGNVAVKIRLNCEKCSLSAKDFALPLLEAGASKR